MLKTSIAILATAIAGSGEPRFEGRSEPIRGKVEERIVGSSWHPGCPVALSKLRLLELSHWGFDGEVHRGRLVVHAGHDQEILAVMKRLFAKRFPIRRIELVDRYGADDHRSMNADNTSAFNCRSSPAPSAGRCTPTAWRSTSTRSRTPTSQARTYRRRPGPSSPTAPATPRA